MKTRTLTKEIKTDEYHQKLTKEIQKFVDEFQELETTPLIRFDDETQKGFGVLTNNGNGSKMKKFRVIVEQYK
jgi:hypothetical protein